MILSEGTIFGEKYYAVEPNLVDFKAFDPNFFHQSWHDIENWCVKTFGPTPEDGIWTPGARWYMNRRRFWFRDKKDLEWFLLKWE